MNEASRCASSGWMMVAVRPAGRRVIVVGGGSVARRRAELFVSRGAMVEMFDPHMTPDSLLPDGVAAQRRPVSYNDIKGAWLVIVATSDCQVNHQVGEWCDELDIACNRADDAEEGTFAVPAMLEDEQGWKIGILGGEAGPLFSVWLKSQLNGLIESEQVERVYLALADARQRLQEEGLTQEERTKRLRAVMASALEDDQSDLSATEEPYTRHQEQEVHK